MLSEAVSLDEPTITADYQITKLNGNEKCAELSRSLPVDAVNPDTIHNGDLMLYGSTTLVVFYKSFLTSYKYTRLGKIDDPPGLAGALGAGNIRFLLMLKYRYSKNP